MRERFDFIYCECSGDIAGAFEKWANRLDDSASPVKTYSSQFFEFARQLGARTYALSGCRRPAISRVDGFLVAHHRRGILHFPLLGYHLEQARYALLLFWLALCHRPRAIFIDSGVTHWIFLTPMRLIGVRVIAVLHNTLWPNGFPPTSPLKRLFAFADSLFFRYVAHAVFCVSPVISRQVASLGRQSLPIVSFGASFEPSHFIGHGSTLAHETRPFRVLFAGRVERNKGVFDLLEAARQLEAEYPGQFAFDVCGDGSDFVNLAGRVEAFGLGAMFQLHGKLDRDQLIARYRNAHAVAAPTRSDFCEGFCQVVAEAILLDRPVITNDVVPALESLRDAIVEFRPDDVDSLKSSIRLLAENVDIYTAKCDACAHLHQWIFDKRRSYLSQLLAHSDFLKLS